MSNESRTTLVVLLVCGALLCGCVILPVGIGAVYFISGSRQAEIAREQALAAEQVARAEAARAVAAEQAAKALAGKAAAEAEAVRRQAELQALLSGLSGLPTIPSDSSVPSPPSVPAPPDLGLPTAGPPGISLPPEIAESLLADVEMRKSLYNAFKRLREAEEGAKKQKRASDPMAEAIMASFKRHIDASIQSLGLTREQIDKIMAEGDKAGW